MTIFSEIYGAYFRVAASAMKQASISEKELRGLIEREGFRDSVLFLPQRLIPQADGTDWGLFRKTEDGRLVPVIHNKPAAIVTKVQKMWLRTLLADPRLRLFLSDKELDLLEKRLDGVPPLFTARHLRCTDRFTDGDDYADEKYRMHFRMLLNAVKTRQILTVAFTTGRGRRQCRQFLPFKIEYSPKNDKFRTYCYSVRNGMLKSYGVLNIGRIDHIAETDSAWGRPVSEKSSFAERRCNEPAVIRVTTERNAAERFLMEFAAYEKHTERDLESGCLTVRIWFDRQDETELLIMLLSFGPVIEILGPADFRRQAAERVKRQWELLDMKKPGAPDHSG